MEAVMKKVVPVIIAFAVLFCFNTAIADEKPLVIKGLYIGMNVNDAKNIIGKLLGKDWETSPVGREASIVPGSLSGFVGDDFIFGAKEGGDRRGAITGEYGFAIINKYYNSYQGFISADQASNKVVRISLSGKITDILFSSSKISADDFVTSFWENYNMPYFNWRPGGWIYTSPKGYVITIMTDKLIDIKKEESVKQEKPNVKFE